MNLQQEIKNGNNPPNEGVDSRVERAVLVSYDPFTFIHLSLTAEPP